MDENPTDPSRATIGNVFRVVNEMRAEQLIFRDEMRRDLGDVRGDLSELRASVEDRLDKLQSRIGGQTESALNVALHAFR